MKMNLQNKLIAYILLITILILLIPYNVTAETVNNNNIDTENIDNSKVSGDDNKLFLQTTDTSNVQLVLSKASLKAGETLDVCIYVKGCKINALFGSLVYTKTNYQTLVKSNIQISTALIGSATYGSWGIPGFNETTGSVYLEEDNYDFYQFNDSTLMAKITFTAAKDVADTTEIQLKGVALTAETEDISIPVVTPTIQGQTPALYLKSKTYTVANTTTTSSYDIGAAKEYVDGALYLSNVPDKMTIANFVNNLDTNGTIKVTSSTDQTLDTSKYIGTGMKVVVSNATKTITLTTVVVGDVDGDGKCSITDLSRMNQAINKSITLADIYKKAADVDSSGTFSISDLSRVNQYLNGTILKIVK